MSLAFNWALAVLALTLGAKGLEEDAAAQMPTEEARSVRENFMVMDFD